MTASASDPGPSADSPPLPAGFRVGHATHPPGDTGCTVVICPPGTRGGVDVRGGGTGTRELEPLSPLANAEGPTAVLLTGGSAFGLAAADGVVRWLEERGLGREMPLGVIPLVPTAVIFDLSAGETGARPGPEEGYAACQAARGGVPERGRVGAGAGAAVGKLLGRERGAPGGVGYAATRLADGVSVAAIAVANAVGDVLAEDGSVLGGPRGEQGEQLRTADIVRRMPQLPDWATRTGQRTTLVCVCTDAPLDKRGCGDRGAGRQRRDRPSGRPGLHSQRRRRGPERAVRMNPGQKVRSARRSCHVSGAADGLSHPSTTADSCGPGGHYVEPARDRPVMDHHYLHTSQDLLVSAWVARHSRPPGLAAVL